MATCTAPSKGHRSASAAANCPACRNRYGGYGARSYSSPSYSSPSSSSPSSSGGGGGRTSRALPSGVPEIYRRPLSEVPSLVRSEVPAPAQSNGQTYDVFISHASEDKDEFVRPLANALIAVGLKVWFDEMTLRIGDSLRQKIDKGLVSSRVGLVVLSPAFIKKGWTNYELDGIVTRSVSGEQILLPIWHNITKQQVMDFSSSIADKVARSTAVHTIDEIAAEIADLLKSNDAQAS
ncbi:toll/interleukin-1 receptor domain-containing protein [Pseudomonas sp.]|uniref:toll/interleukin-1 receptor domain-containing protein n=1 Tax=Pseudomonas sp. TaxID=306 RepID=UPI003D700B1A